jgi:hypothetical protein
MKTREDFRGKKGFIIIGLLAVSLALGLGGGVVLKNKKAESKAMVSAKETVKELSVKGTDGKSFKRDSFEHKTEAPDYAKSNETVSTDNAGGDGSNPDTGSGAENIGNIENTSPSNPVSGNSSASANENKNSGKKSGAKTNIKSASNTSGNQGNASAKQNRKASAGETAAQPASTAQPASNSQQAQPVQPAKPSGHYETRQVLVSAAWDQPVMDVIGCKCNTCGQFFKTEEEMNDHFLMFADKGDYTHGSDSAVFGQVSTIHHDAVYKDEQVWVED